MTSHFVIYTHPSRTRSIAVEYNTSIFASAYVFEDVEWVQSRHLLADSPLQRKSLVEYLTNLNIDIIPTDDSSGSNPS